MVLGVTSKIVGKPLKKDKQINCAIHWKISHPMNLWGFHGFSPLFLDKNTISTNNQIKPPWCQQRSGSFRALNDPYWEYQTWCRSVVMLNVPWCTPTIVWCGDIVTPNFECSERNNATVPSCRTLGENFATILPRVVLQLNKIARISFVYLCFIMFIKKDSGIFASVSFQRLLSKLGFWYVFLELNTSTAIWRLWCRKALLTWLLRL